MPEPFYRFGEWVVPPVVATIGPITAKTARDAGLSVSVQADPHTVAALVEGLAGFAASSGARRAR